MSGDLKKTSIYTLVVVAGALLGWFLVQSASRNAQDKGTSSPQSTPPLRPRPAYDRPDPGSKEAREARNLRAADDPTGAGISGERIVMFDSDEAYRDFLAALDGSGVRLLGRLDKLRALRLGYDDLNALRDLLGDQDSLANFIVSIPPQPGEGASFSGGAGFGNALFEWLGFPHDNAHYGEGIRVAIIDTGISPDSPLAGMRQVDLLSEYHGESPEFHPHGDTMASILLGAGNQVQGLAPSADAISFRIGDETGYSSSFLLAEAIVAAVDSGANIINISMGSDYASGLVNAAVDYAAQRNVLIVASAGNNGQPYLSSPASNDYVVAVGSIDANGSHASFSNMGDALDLSAPGIDIPSLAGEDLTWSTGTSPSAMVTTGLIVATASELGLSIPDAYDLITSNLNEAGAPGTDPVYGGGSPDFWRILNSQTSGIYDIALVSPYYQAATEETPYDALLFTVENRGTEPVSNIELEVYSELGTRPYVVGSLQPDETSTVTLRIPAALEALAVDARATLPANLSDQRMSNNRISGALSRSQGDDSGASLDP